MRLTGETKIFIGIIGATILIVIASILLMSQLEKQLNRSEVAPQESYTRGPSNAKVTLMEFSDFQCPACMSFKPLVDSIVQKNSTKLLFVYRHFPLPQHEFAQKEALAAEAAGKQGKFWQMYDYLFENQERVSDKMITEGVSKLQLNEKKFYEDMGSSSLKQKIFKDVSDGKRFGVDATPTFFLNGRRVTLIERVDLERQVDQALKQ